MTMCVAAARGWSAGLVVRHECHMCCAWGCMLHACMYEHVQHGPARCLVRSAAICKQVSVSTLTCTTRCIGHLSKGLPPSKCVLCTQVRPDSYTGQRALAELVFHLLLSTLNDVKGRPLQEDERQALEQLYGPMIEGGWHHCCAAACALAPAVLAMMQRHLITLPAPEPQALQVRHAMRTPTTPPPHAPGTRL